MNESKEWGNFGFGRNSNPGISVKFLNHESLDCENRDWGDMAVDSLATLKFIQCNELTYEVYVKYA